MEQVRSEHNLTEAKTGTKEWACTNVNFLTGCRHRCKYCYAEQMAVTRFHRTQDWSQMVVNEAAAERAFCQRSGRIMFPSTHDLFPEHLPIILKLLRRMLVAGNDVLIVSKPHLEVVQAICKAVTTWYFGPWKKLEFRFTIGSRSSETLKTWEPGAPSFEERLACLHHAYSAGFMTSVSIEPYLDYDLFPLVCTVEPYCRGEIWIGCMNHGFPEELKSLYTRGQALQIYEDAYRDPYPGMQKLRWKDSFRKLGICDNYGRTI